MRTGAGSSTTVKDFAPAKINLYLHVLGRRAEGYHLLDSLIAFADIGDEVTAAPADTLSLTVGGPEAEAIAELGDDNLVMRAARLLVARVGISAGAALQLDKRLPAAAGIGGGSSDAAATLRALSRLWKHPLDEQSLTPSALELAADVPVCLAAPPAWPRGLRQALEPAGPSPPPALAPANPPPPPPPAAAFHRPS